MHWDPFLVNPCWKQRMRFCKDHFGNLGKMKLSLAATHTHHLKGNTLCDLALFVCHSAGSGRDILTFFTLANCLLGRTQGYCGGIT